MPSIGTRVRQLISRHGACNQSRRDILPQYNDVGGATTIGTGIAFTSTNTITDSNNGLAKFAAGQLIEILGSNRNSRTFLVETSAAGTLTVSPAVVTTESAGPTIIVRST